MYRSENQQGKRNPRKHDWSRNVTFQLGTRRIENYSDHEDGTEVHAQRVMDGKSNAACKRWILINT